MKRLISIASFAGLLCAASAQAATITSTSFSLGYGADTGGPVAPQSVHWTDNETSGSNTDVTGPFTASVAFTSRTPSPDGDSVYDNGASSSGPIFTGRTLADSPGGVNTGFSSWSPRFQATVSGTYTGPPPIDVAVVANYQFSVVITSIRIWGTAVIFNTDGLEDLFFTETTPLHGTSSLSQTLPTAGASAEQAAAYAQLVWDPADFSTPGVTDGRVFVLDTAAFPHQRGIDGFEVFGHLVLTYDAIPEPASLGLLALGGLLLLRRR